MLMLEKMLEATVVVVAIKREKLALAALDTTSVVDKVTVV